MLRMRFSLAALAAVFLAAALAFSSPNPAAAIDLQAARSGGLVGETLSGYVAPVTSPSGESVQTCGRCEFGEARSIHQARQAE